MKKAIVLLNGEESVPTSLRSTINPQDYIVCADGGAQIALRLKIRPSIIVGDFDSLSHKSIQYFKQQNVPFLRFSKEKNETDAEIALRHIVKQKIRDVFVYGFLGKRTDHFLATLHLPLSPVFSSLDVVYVSRSQLFFYIRKRRVITAAPRSLISLLPMSSSVSGITTRGLKYPLSNESLIYGLSRGVSNVFTHKKAIIAVRHGIVLAIVTPIKESQSQS